MHNRLRCVWESACTSVYVCLGMYTYIQSIHMYSIQIYPCIQTLQRGRSTKVVAEDTLPSFHTHQLRIVPSSSFIYFEHIPTWGLHSHSMKLLLSRSLLIFMLKDMVSKS